MEVEAGEVRVVLGDLNYTKNEMGLHTFTNHVDTFRNLSSEWKGMYHEEMTSLAPVSAWQLQFSTHRSSLINLALTQRDFKGH